MERALLTPFFPKAEMEVPGVQEAQSFEGTQSSGAEKWGGAARAEHFIATFLLDSSRIVNTPQKLLQGPNRMVGSFWASRS